MSDDIKRTVLITGSVRGIGEAAAIAFAEKGYNVAVNCRNKARLAAAEKVAERCRKFGVEAECFAADVSLQEECSTLVDAVVKRFGTVDVLVNNAGIYVLDMLSSASPDDFRRMVAVNQESVFYMMKLCSKYMMKNKFGRIINITSSAGLYGAMGLFSYSAAKGAVAAMTRSAAKELASRKITVNAIAPGMVRTDMSAEYTDEQKKMFLRNVGMHRFAEPEEIAAAAVFLASEKAAYITGEILEINGSLAR